MKKIFVAVLAMAGVVACNTVDTLDVPQNPEIRFANAFVENATRADEALDPSTTTNTLTGFNVWGFMDQTDGTVFVAEDVTGSKGNFSYANIQYWAPGHTYYFAALAPIDSANVKDFAAEVAGATEEEKFVKTVFNFKNVEGTEDLLYAAAKEVAPAMGASKTVMLTFDHLLSKVKFSFTNGFTNPNAYIDVKNVTMAVPATATATLTKDAYTWANQAGELTLEFGDACSKTAAGEKQVAADERLTIPAGAEQNYTVTFEVALYMGDVVAYTGTKTATIEGVALEIGKAYNFSATLNASNITADGTELQPIVFDVEEVKDWVENVPVDEVIDTDEELAAVLSNNSFPYSQINVKLGADLTYNVGAREVGAMGSVGTEVITIDLNGHTLTFNQTNSDWNNINTNGAKLVIKNGKITNAGNNNGPWNRHDLNFACPVELVNVVSDKAIALAKDATLTKVTINDANTSDTYAVWVRPMGQTVVLDECTIDMLACSDGRGLKIDNQYLSAAEEAKVTLKVSNTVFKTEEKSAILVKTTKGAEINWGTGNSIAEVAADTNFAVWVDEDSAAVADKVVVNGAFSKVEGSADTVVTTADELVAALAKGNSVIFLNDITVAATKGGYSKAGILQNKTQTIDGNGHTLTVTGAGATKDCAIYTNGGVIKNLTVAGAMRGIFTAGQSSDLHIENVKFKNVIYTFNSDGKMPANPFGVYVSNSTVNGWTSHSDMHTEVVYTNCSFGEGSGYKYCRPYGKTAFVNCTFCAGYTIDKSQTKDITFENCTFEE